MNHRIPLIGSREKKFSFVFFMVLLLIFLASTAYTRYNPLELLFRGEEFWTFLKEDFFPPKLSNPPSIFSAIAVTLALAVISTFIAMVLALITAVYISSNTAPILWLAKCIRAVVTLMRNIPSLIWAYILFSALGIGTGVACLALIISSYAFLTRMFVEVIDELPPNALEPVIACGGTFGQRVFHCVLPNCIPNFIEWFLYSLEINIRSSTIVGMVGGGGIGLLLFMYIKSFNYRAAAGIILVIAAMVILVERITGKVRKQLEGV